MKTAILETYACNGMEFVGALDIDGPFLAETVGYFQYHQFHVIHLTTYPSRDLGAKDPRQHLRELVHKVAMDTWKTLITPIQHIIPQTGF